MISTPPPTVTTLCPRCRRGVVLPANAKAGACPFCGAKIAGQAPREGVKQ